MFFHLRYFSALIFICFLFIFATGSSQAAQQYEIMGQQAMTVGLPGGLAGLLKPNGSTYTADPYGFGITSFSLLAVLDTGASGCVLSATDAGPDGLNIPILSNETYVDVGIGGNETFNISQLTPLILAPIGLMASFDPFGTDPDPSENRSNYTTYGSYNFQIRQSDPLYAGIYPLNMNLVGTPVLNQYVMHVTPNSSGYTSMIPTVDYLVTDLLPAVPSDLPSSGVFRVGLSYENFVKDPTSVSTSTNPIIHNIKLTLGQKDITSNWLFDTGGSVTMIGRDMAVNLGIDLSSDPVTTTNVIGVGNVERTLFGYKVDSLAVPLANGDELVYKNIVVFVPEDGALPADLTGIFGMNLLNQSFPTADDIYSLTDSPFSDWYVDPFNNQLVLVLAVPEPTIFVMLFTAGTLILLWRVQRRRSGCRVELN
jgi:hypothetical protein